jgi:iron complex transport system substrate-binding protein
VLSRPLAAALAVLLAVAVAACGGDGASDAGQATTTAASEAPLEAFPVTVEADNGPLVVEERPTRIVSLSPTATESLFAIGAGEQVAAVDDQSTYPQEAPRTDLSGFQPNVEAIAGYEPDLVVAGFDPAASSTGSRRSTFPSFSSPPRPISRARTSRSRSSAPLRATRRRPRSS